MRKRHKNIPRHETRGEILARYARENSIHKTHAEAILEQALIERNIKFQSQKIIIVRGKGYIADFYLEGKYGTKLIIEVDGPYHECEDQQRKDANRSAALRTKNYVILRFSNTDIEQALDKCLSKLLMFKPYSLPANSLR
jgi:5-methyltetrahydrofolate--homocysteine methyltransferase/ATP-dependent helicase HrpA